MPLETRTLIPGTQLSTRYHRETFTCTVESDEGKLVFILADGRRFTSLSAAASAVMGGASVNGWRAWSLADGTISAEGEGSIAPATAPTGRKAARSTQLIRKVKSQQGVPAGEVKFFCGACLDGFMVPAGEAPAACPRGHTESEAPTA